MADLQKMAVVVFLCSRESVFEYVCVEESKKKNRKAVRQRQNKKNRG